MEYMTIAEAAAKWNISNRRIQVLCPQERIPVGCRISHMWAIHNTKTPCSMQDVYQLAVLQNTKEPHKENSEPIDDALFAHCA